MYRIVLGILMLAAVSMQAAPAVKDAPKDDKKDAVATHLEKLAGQWKLEKEIRDGVERKPEDVQLIFKGDNVTLTEHGEAMEATFKIDPSKTPAEMDITLKKGNREETIRAVYQIDGDTLIFAFRKDGEARPEKLASAAGSKVTLGTLKRVKK